MELPLRLQAAQFAAALLFGLLCGVVYDLLRAPRCRIPALTVPADLLYALFLLLGLLALALYVGGGRLRLFFYPAIALGAALYFRVLSPFVLRALNAALGAVGRVLRLLLWPGQKFLKISRIFFKKFFASVKKWFTIFDKMKSRRNARIPERSSAKHEIRQVIAAGEAGHSDRGGLRRGNAGVAPQSDRGQKRRGRRAHKQHHGR